MAGNRKLVQRVVVAANGIRYVGPYGGPRQHKPAAYSRLWCTAGQRPLSQHLELDVHLANGQGLEQTWLQCKCNTRWRPESNEPSTCPTFAATGTQE